AFARPRLPRRKPSPIVEDGRVEVAFLATRADDMHLVAEVPRRRAAVHVRPHRAMRIGMVAERRRLVLEEDAVGVLLEFPAVLLDLPLDLDEVSPEGRRQPKLHRIHLELRLVGAATRADPYVHAADPVRIGRAVESRPWVSH